MSKIVRLDPIFNDHMVLQRNKSFQVWGIGEDGMEVKVTCRNESSSAEVIDGKWSVTFAAMNVGDPCELIVQTDETTITLVDVVFGDVWLAGGQSNMEWPLKSSEGAEFAIAAADLPLIRFYDVPKVAFEVPGIKFKSKWKVCTPENAGELSAVAYYFARDIIAYEQVPIGIVGCNWGGTSASCWVDEAVLNADSELSIYTKQFAEQMQGFDWQEFKQTNKDYNEAVAKYNHNVEAGINREELGTYPWPPPMSPQSFTRPSGLYETMLRKVFAYTLKGVIFYQGESDEHRPEMYSRLLETLILDWRKQWQDPELPFLFAQLPIYASNGNPYGEEWPLIREAQQLTADRVPFTGMAVLLDCGEENDIHPLNKKPVGERLALLALNKVYGRAIKSSGPMFSSINIEGDKAVIQFDYAEAGLVAKAGNRLVGFEIAAEDGLYKTAEAEIDEAIVTVKNAKIAAPRYVRYGWANVTDANLMGLNGLPAAPFRTK